MFPPSPPYPSTPYLILSHPPPVSTPHAQTNTRAAAPSLPTSIVSAQLQSLPPPPSGPTGLLLWRTPPNPGQTAFPVARLAATLPPATSACPPSMVGDEQQPGNPNPLTLKPNPNFVRVREEGGDGGVVWTSLGPLPRWVQGPTTWWAPGTTRLVPHGT
jgi:hypothetical protein